MAFAVAAELTDRERLKLNKSEHMDCPPDQRAVGQTTKEPFRDVR